MDRRCTKCGEVKAVSEFSKDARGRDGRRSWCKACLCAQQRAYREANPEKIRIYDKAYREANREKECAWQKAYREANREKIRIYDKAWREANPEKRCATRARRNARKNGAAGQATAEQRAARQDYYGGRCYICGAPAEAMDHVIPLARGGSNWPANLRPICRSCNSMKGAKWPYDIEQVRLEATT